MSKKLKFDAKSVGNPNDQRPCQQPLREYSGLVEGPMIEETPLLSRKSNDDAQHKTVSLNKSKPPASALEGEKDKRDQNVLNRILKELEEIRATLSVDVADIKERLAALTAKVQLMGASKEGPNEVHDMKCLEEFKFPVDDFEILVLVEEEISTNQDFKFCMVEYLLNRATLHSK